MAILAVATGSSIQTWDYLTSETNHFEPHGDALITDLAWNHNGLGEHGEEQERFDLNVKRQCQYIIDSSRLV